MSEEYLNVLNEETKNKAKNSFKERIPKLKLMDDYYFMIYAQRFPEDFAMIVSEFIGKDIKIVPDSFQTQEVVASKDNAKDVRYDLTADTVDGGKVVLEMESRKKFNDLRLRYYMSKIDGMLLNKGENYEDLKESNIIIVSNEDKRKQNEPRYVMRMCYVKSLTEIGDNPEIVDNGQAVTFINTSYQNEEDKSKLANLIHDFKCDDPEEMKTDIIKEHSKMLKDSQEGRDFMVSEVKNYMDKFPLYGGRLLTEAEQDEFRNEGRLEGRLEVIKTAFRRLMIPVLKKGEDCSFAKKIYMTMFPECDSNTFDRELNNLQKELGVKTTNKDYGRN